MAGLVADLLVRVLSHKTLDMLPLCILESRLRLNHRVKVLALVGGLYVIPLSAMIQRHSPWAIRSRLQSASSILNLARNTGVVETRYRTYLNK